MRRKIGGGLLAALFLSACASAPKLPGTWRGSSANATGTILDFHRAGALSWTFPGGAVEARWVARGRELDITDFSGGMLQGSALYCIYELEAANRMRMDCERGKPGQTDVRPKDFDAQQTQSFER
ncbi:MAG TPA: hypothetical protein VND45_06265 [Thermoanaerobaculia bacterium]|nr:hypothetical protein [Thermoanaerobaculia bacterium]